MPSKPRLADPGTLIRTGWKPRTAEFRVCVEPDLAVEYEELKASRDAAVRAADDSLSGKGAAGELDKQLAALLAQIESVTITLSLQAVTRPAFRALVDKFPPRRDGDGKITNGLDAQLGVNFDGFMAELIPASLTAPALDPETLALLLDERLTDQQYVSLAMTCWTLNREELDVPFSPAGSPNRRTSSRR